MNLTLLLSYLLRLSAAAPSVVSLGSSYSAGYGLNESYGKVLADLLQYQSGVPATYTNLSISGSNVTDVTANQAAKLGGKTYTAAVITAGGNDLNYVSCLFNPKLNYCGKTINETELTRRYSAALDAIFQNMGNSTPLYVVTYTEALGNKTDCGSNNPNCTFTPAEVQTSTTTYNNVIDWTVNAVSSWKKTAENSKYKVKLIPMRQYSNDNHYVGTEQPWMNGAIDRHSTGDGANWHPNEAGAKFMAQTIFNDLNGEGPPPY